MARGGGEEGGRKDSDRKKSGGSGGEALNSDGLGNLAAGLHGEDAAAKVATPPGKKDGKLPPLDVVKAKDAKIARDAAKEAKAGGAAMGKPDADNKNNNDKHRDLSDDQIVGLGGASATDKAIVICQEANDNFTLNTGQFLVRNCEASIKYMQAWLDKCPSNSASLKTLIDQPHFMKVYEENAWARGVVDIREQREFNSFWHQVRE